MTDQAPQVPTQTDREKKQHLMISLRNLCLASAKAPMAQVEHEACVTSARQLEMLIQDTFPEPEVDAPAEEVTG